MSQYPTLINIKNGSSQTGIFDTDESNKIFLGGGRNDRARFVSEEFADLVGKDIKISQIEPLLDEVIDDGVGGVELKNITPNSFILDIDANAGTTDRIIFTGGAAQSAIDNVAGDLINIKNGSSQLAIFNAEDDNDKIFIGGGRNDREKFVSEEFADLVGKDIKGSQIAPLLEEVIDDGVDGVKLNSISTDSFTLEINGNASTTETIIFTGEVVEDAITGLAKGGVNIPDRRSQFGIFNFDSTDGKTSRFFLGGGASAKSLVSQEFDDLIGGSMLSENEIEALFEAATGLDGGDGKIDNVEFLGGISPSNFALGLNVDSRGTMDVIVFNDTSVM